MVIPSLRSISNLRTHQKEHLSDPFEQFKANYDYDEVHLELLVYRNLSSNFDLQNKQPKLLRALFSGQARSDKTEKGTQVLDHVKTHSLPGKLLKIYGYMLELFEYQYFLVRGHIKPLDSIEMQNAVDQGRKYWKVDEANGAAQKALNLPEPDDDEGRIDASLALEDEGLSQKIIEKIMNDKRGQNQVYDEFAAIGKGFEAVKQVVES